MPQAPKRTPKASARWQISRITGKRALLLGQVDAPDAATAIKTGIEKFDVEPEQRDRVMARPIAQTP